MGVLDILLVDDDPAITDLLNFILLAHGHCVRLASSLAAARHELARSVPHVIVSDWQLGDGTGDQLLAGVAAQHPTVRRILVSATLPDDWRDWIARKIATQVFEKPLNPVHLFYLAQWIMSSP